MAVKFYVISYFQGYSLGVESSISTAYSGLRHCLDKTGSSCVNISEGMRFIMQLSPFYLSCISIAICWGYKVRYAFDSQRADLKPLNRGL